MSTQTIALLKITLQMTGTVTANRFVTPAGILTGADLNAIGVVRSSGVSGDKLTVDVMGTAQVEAGGTIAAGATLKSDSTGRGITWVTSGARVGIALEAGAVGQMIEVLLLPNAA